MVLGSSAVAFAAYTSDDVDNAKTVIGEYDKFAGEFNDGKFATSTAKAVTFSTTYTVRTNSGDKSIAYNYAFTGTGVGNFVKVGPSTDAAKAAGIKDAALVDASASNRVTAHVNDDNVMNNSVVATDLLKLDDGVKTNYYYVSQVVDTYAGTDDTVTFNNAAGDTKVAVLKAYDPTTLTGTIVYGDTADFQDEWGVDPDGYIGLASGASTMKLYNTVNKNYYVSVSKASSATLAIANALNAGTLTKNAVAVDIQFYAKEAITGYSPVTYSSYAVQGDFQQLYAVNYTRDDVSLTLKTDWLSRTNLKSADAVSVYVLDTNVGAPSIFSRVGDLVSLGNVENGTFSADYLLSGVYIFDEASAASNNDGVSDTDTTATTTAATAATSPKTGDIAPIAALAVVMMGACGAMVVASKKRA
jgi:hypothetical protein